MQGGIYEEENRAWTKCLAILHNALPCSGGVAAELCCVHQFFCSCNSGFEFFDFFTFPPPFKSNRYLQNKLPLMGLLICIDFYESRRWITYVVVYRFWTRRYLNGNRWGGQDPSRQIFLLFIIRNLSAVVGCIGIIKAVYIMWRHGTTNLAQVMSSIIACVVCFR